MLEGRTDLARTSAILEDMLRGVMSFLKMTMETGENFLDGRLPTLDMKLWVEDN